MLSNKFLALLDMERLLRPDCSEGSQDTVPAQWTHWHYTFSNFTQSVSPEPDKLKLLINYICPDIYSHITHCKTCEDTVKVLKTVHVKPKNISFARHLLTTCRQQLSKAINSYLQSLKLLSKECEFKVVTADIYNQEAICDAFIMGLASPDIHQL